MYGKPEFAALSPDEVFGLIEVAAFATVVTNGAGARRLAPRPLYETLDMARATTTRIGYGLLRAWRTCRSPELNDDQQSIHCRIGPRSIVCLRPSYPGSASHPQ
jgi:hypothetical protein